MPSTKTKCNSTDGVVGKSKSSKTSTGGSHTKKKSEDTRHVRVVSLYHNAKRQLGLEICGGVGGAKGNTPISVSKLIQDDPAERSGKLKIGDNILSINGVSTEGMSQVQVFDFVKSSQDPIILEVTDGDQSQVGVESRSSGTEGAAQAFKSVVPPKVPAAVKTPSAKENKAFQDEQAIPKYKTRILKKGPDGFGFSIVGGGNLPIYVTDVFPEGEASENGQLKTGDQILKVNGSSLEGLKLKEVVNILRNLTGYIVLEVIAADYHRLIGINWDV